MFNRSITDSSAISSTGSVTVSSVTSSNTGRFSCKTTSSRDSDCSSLETVLSISPETSISTNSSVYVSRFLLTTLSFKEELVESSTGSYFDSVVDSSMNVGLFFLLTL